MLTGRIGVTIARNAGGSAALDEETLALARRAAACVVIKERSEYILRQYGCTEFIGGKYSRIKYGILA